MSDFKDELPSPPVSGFVKITSDDGRESCFSNYVMMDHYKVILNSLIGQENGEIGAFGAGTSVTAPNAKNISQMTSEIESSSESSYAQASSREPVEQLSELDIEINDVPTYVKNKTAAVAFTGTFGAKKSSNLDDKEISEIALFTNDKNDPKNIGEMFARTIIPKEERIEKFAAGSLTFYWVIYYGFEEFEFKDMNEVIA